MPGALDIRVERMVRSDPEQLFAFLSDLENHWHIADGFVEVLELNGAGPGQPARGARVRMHGPLGVRRTAATRVTELEPPRRIAGTARVGTHTAANVTWTFTGVDGGTLVGLAAQIDRASFLDRTLLAAGGNRWLRRRLEKILTGLDEGRR
jgi:uncharacterized protein YndB with AHSA1/START domain